MRWKAWPSPKPGSTRQKKKFFWFPQRVGEFWYWLESRLVEQTYNPHYIHRIEDAIEGFDDFEGFDDSDYDEDGYRIAYYVWRTTKVIT